MPAVIGGGLGDIEEVLAAGRALGAVDRRIRLFRVPGRPIPRAVDGPWDWPTHRRVDRLDPRAARALTISPMWGVSAAPARPEPLGRAGPWAAESEAIERAYGPESVVHVSLEEFARTLTSRQEESERRREGGLSMGPSGGAATRAATSEARATFHRLYRKFRAFDRANVLHLFQTFVPSTAFASEYPEAVQAGPLWPHRFRPGSRRGPRSPGVRHQRWVWYASPASSEGLLRTTARAWPSDRSPPAIDLRSPRPLPVGRWAGRWVLRPPEPPAAWARRFSSADLRVVTGSRTLLEALELGGPFLYFNGLLGRGGRARRHRPEKIRSLLAAGRLGGIDPSLLHDLDAFSRGREVPRIVRTACADGRWASRFPDRWPIVGFRTPFQDAARLLGAIARRWTASRDGATELVAAVRREGRPERRAG
ncbi:MAG TPA: hypothetical protein VGV64_04010 [Thermoplasmata archaeon]|nr:hypothetical protein [Thermoplasmata archaeon]